jgi:hypothetical protein
LTESFQGLVNHNPVIEVVEVPFHQLDYLGPFGSRENILQRKEYLGKRPMGRRLSNGSYLTQQTFKATMNPVGLGARHAHKSVRDSQAHDRIVTAVGVN